MKTIVIGFSRSTKKIPLGSWAIMLWQGGTPYSHCYIKLLTKDRFPSNKILHAAEGQVSNYSETAFLKRNKVIKEFILDIPKSTYVDLVRNVFHELSGEPYSTMQNVGIVYVQLMKLIGKKVKNPWKNGWNCSEYVLKVLNFIYPEEAKKYDLNTVTPKDIYCILNKCINNSN